MSDEFAKGYKYGNFVTNNFPYNLPIIRDLERFSINNFHQTIPFTGDPKLTAGYDKGVADMTLALKNKPRQGEKMTAQELMQILAPQPKPVAVNNNDAINAMRAANNTAGAVGNVTDNEMTMFSGNPMNGALAGGNVGNASDNEVDMMINRLNEIKAMGQKGILTDDLKQEAMFIQKNLPPIEVMPPDVDNLNLSPEALRELLNVIESPNFRGFPMRGGR
jgi:sulfur carrier protein ThiS